MVTVEQHDASGNRIRWCILRTSGGRTLPLAKSLASAGFDVWTPVQTLTKRRGRARERIAYDAPIMPTFVFARADQLPSLARIASQPFSSHPSFSIFRHLGRVPLISDGEVAEARRVEERGRRAALVGTRKSFVVGQQVRVSDGPGAGLSGEVIANGDGKFVLVAFGTINMKIGAWLLGTDEVQTTELAA
ncbi:transcription termination/antitermination protein NusG [Sphingomonas sp. CV7422]|uniref:transcription termination/antitermination protein NusG n=1 Tax=Sphingomonas sp. CV7422 TaxID=3018036 RepID=UPI0022FE84D2|nr:transcription termination/antitermination NusG family protein [Sphingomonas sp. CV7422]